MEISSRTLIPLFRPGSVHSGSASLDDCGRVFSDELRVGLFPRLVPTLCLDSIVSPLRLRWVKGVCVIRCNLPPALLAEWPGSFTCHCGNTGMERTSNKNRCRKLTLEKKILLPRLELATFRSLMTLALCQQAIPGKNEKKGNASEVRIHAGKVRNRQGLKFVLKTKVDQGVKKPMSMIMKLKTCLFYLLFLTHNFWM